MPGQGIGGDLGFGKRELITDSDKSLSVEGGRGASWWARGGWW